MRYLFDGYPRGFFTVPLLNILSSLILTGLVWFFSFIFLGEKSDFLMTWRLVYIYTLVFWFVMDAIAIVLRGFAGLHYSNKFEASFGDIMEAMVKHELFKKNRRDYKTWTPDVFKAKLGEARTVSIFASAIMKALSD